MLVNPRSIVRSMKSCLGAIELTVATKPKTMEKVMSSEKLVAGGEREQWKHQFREMNNDRAAGISSGAMKMRNSSQLSTLHYIHRHGLNYNIPSTIGHNTQHDDTSSNFHKRNLITFYFHEVQADPVSAVFRENEWLFVLGNRSGFSFVLDHCACVCVAADHSRISTTHTHWSDLCVIR